MTKKTLKQREEDPTYWKDKDDLYIHYLYKITNKTNQRYYIGIHSILKSKGVDPINDGYYGSGTEIRKAVKEEGKSNFSKEILKIFSTRDELREAEKDIVTEDIVKDSMSYNKTLGGGKNNCSKVYAVEKSTGKSILIDNEEYFKNRDLYEPVIKDSVAVRKRDDLDEKYFLVSREEYYKNKDKYLTINSGKVLVKKLDGLGNPVGDYIYVDKGEYYNNKESYILSLPGNKGKVACRSVKDPEDKLLLDYDDPRYISGEYIPVARGKKFTEEQKEKKRGSGNSMYGRVFVSNGKVNKSVKKEELEDFLKNNPGWKRGRSFEYKVTKNKKFPMIIHNFSFIDEFNEVAERLPKMKVFNYTNGKENVRITEDLISKYESLGYHRGVTQFNGHKNHNPNFGCKGYRWVNDSISVNKFIRAEELDSFLSIGWKLGIILNKK